MYLPIESKLTCATAWLEATKSVEKLQNHEANNVIVDIQKPLLERPEDIQIVKSVDEFLKTSEKLMPLQSIANTIFPQALYQKHGSPEFYDAYQKVYKRIMKQRGQWGRYFHRMTCCTTMNGTEINPLQNIVEKLRNIVDGDSKKYKNIYELAVHAPTLSITTYNPVKDASRVMNRQCLSFLSFKLDGSNRLNLTAMYRNHYYVGRLLGNLIGLARLMAFIGQEASVEIGQLTIVSTHAKVETPDGFMRGDVKRLLEKCSNNEVGQPTKYFKVG